MGFFSRFFGGSDKAATAKTVEPVKYKGYLIYQESLSEGGQYRIAGRIEKDSDGEVFVTVAGKNYLPSNITRVSNP